MANYSIYIHGTAFPVSGYEAAWAAFRSACDFADVVGGNVALVDNTTGEVIEDNGEEM